MRDRLIEALVWLSHSPELSLVVKATAILVAALVIARLAMRARASARHVIIASSFAALAALPALVAFGPAVVIEINTPAPRTETVVSSSNGAAVPAADSEPAPRASTPASPVLSPSQWLRIAWAAGAIVFLLPVVAAVWRQSAIRRTAIPVARHRAALARLADARGVALPVELLEHEAVPGPMTFGISRPVIVLPPDAGEWSDAELRRALMHELEHVQRGDWLMHIVARAVAALYWFHPLAWSAWRRLCLEAERSCDDAVVMNEEGTEYAEQLVSLAQRMAATPVQPMLGMANRSDLSTRVTAVLDDRLRRGRTGLAFAAGIVVAAAVIAAAVAPVRAMAKQEPSPRTAELRSRIERVAAEMKAIDRLRRDEEARKRPDYGKVRAIDRALYEAAKDGETEEVMQLVQAGANPSATVYGDGNPLIGAARSGRLEIARYLLDQGADPNGVVPGDGSPLINAAQRGRLDQVRLLVDRGADVNLAVEGDENPLMNAAEGGYLEIVEYLVSRGADVNVRIYTEKFNGEGEWRTALSQARNHLHTGVVKFLESRGARD